MTEVSKCFRLNLLSRSCCATVETSLLQSLRVQSRSCGDLAPAPLPFFGAALAVPCARAGSDSLSVLRLPPATPQGSVPGQVNNACVVPGTGL